MSVAAPLQTAAAKPRISALPIGGGLLQRKCACVSSKPPLDEARDDDRPRALQKKLTIGSSNAPLEQEADQVANQGLSVPTDSAVGTAPPRIQRFKGHLSGRAATAPVSVDRVLASSGAPLEPVLRQDMEQRFGYDFSRVRVHSGTAAEQSAKDVYAHAYTVGSNIVFGAGRFAPETREGKRLIAHELTHVVQQTSAGQTRVGRTNEGHGLSASSDASHERVELARVEDGEAVSEPLSDATQSSVQGGIPPFINPDVFDFAPDPTTSNWQTTSCVCIVFGYGSPFLPRTKLEVGVIVSAPLVLRDGRKLSVREAQLDSGNAAEAAAGIIKVMLDSHTIGSSEVQPRFVGFMGGAIMSTGLGYRVRGCYPKCPR